MLGILTVLILSPLLVPAVVGELLARGHFLGYFALVLLLSAGYVGWRVYYDERFGRLGRRVALLAAVLSTGVLALSCVFFAGERAFLDWQKDLHAGFGIRPGMPLEEARSRIEERAIVGATDGSGFLVGPKGLASLHIALMAQYGVAVSTDAAGRVASVRGWSD